MKRRNKDAADFTLSESEHNLMVQLVAAGYSPGVEEIGGYITRVAKPVGKDRVFIPGPFEAGRRYVATENVGGAALTFRVLGWIRGETILRDGKLSELTSQASGRIITRRRFMKVPRTQSGSAAATPANQEALKELYELESLGMAAFARAIGYDLSTNTASVLDTPLRHVEVAGFTIRASRSAGGDEIFLSEPLEPERRYVATVLSQSGDGWKVGIPGWIWGRDALRNGRPSTTAWRGVWLKEADFNTDFGSPASIEPPES